ncbi:MAG: IS66 family transposase [Solirubrobacteraceae bacterium]
MPLASEVSRRPSYVELEALVAEQVARIAELEALVGELRARVDQSSRNSSKPPSSDGYDKPPAERNNERSLRRRSGRKPGGQPGHKGHHLQRREDPDRAVLHAVEVCDCCGRDLSAAPIEQSQSRQVFDLPEMPALECVEHWIHKRRCQCGHLTSSSFPAGVTAPVCYGPRIRALGVYLVSYQHLPYERAAEILSDWAGVTISVATLQAFVAQGADGLEEFLEEIRSQLAGAEVAHFDETGGRIDGRLGWIHSASTQTLTLLTMHRKRGVEAMIAAGVLPAFRGVAVHDGWAPYRNFEDAVHALCGAHHLRELIAAEEQGQAWALAMGCLLLDTKDAVEQAKTAGRERLSRKALAELHASYREIVKLGYEENPILAGQHKGRQPKRTKAQNLLIRLDQREREALRFAHDFRVPFDNNLSERDLRMIKLQQKISGCWRTTQGAERFLAIRSYLSTSRKQGRRPLEVLSQLAAGQPWVPLAASP